MKKNFLYKSNIFILFFIFLISTLYATANIKEVNAAIRNDYPIILVHGIYGWSNEEINSFNYWGGNVDLVKTLNDKGYKAMNATLGTFSSNWDRACELYYYIKGGTVDYGAAHSAKYGHERYGKTFPGIYKEWDENFKIHMIGHNYGGETIRLLIELLKNGDKDEQNYYTSHESEGISSLFVGGKSWIKSITTLASQLNGATFVNFVKKNNVKNLYVSLGGLPTLYNNNPKYDFKIDQWGLKRNANESIYSYYQRVQKSKYWDSEDNAIGDLTTEGAANLNSKTRAYPDIYYFSYSGNISYKNVFTGYYLPKELIWTPSATITGRYTQNNTLPFGDSAWWKNDGAVSVISAQYPFDEPHKNYNGIIDKGVWNVYQVLENWSQEDFVGLGAKRNYPQLTNLYRNIADTLKSLPK